MRKDEKHYRILVVEDNPGDFVIVEDLLTEQILLPDITHATNYKSAFDLLKTGNTFDVILLDLSLPDKSGEQLVSEMLEIASWGCPVIILTGYTDIDFSIKSVSAGISDYLIKDDLNAPMLYKSIIYAIERKKNISQLEISEKKYSDLFNLSFQCMWLYDPQTFKFIKVNKATTALYGYSEAEFLTMTMMDIMPAEDIAKAVEDLQSGNIKNRAYKNSTKHRKKNGEIIEVEISSTEISINDKLYKSVIAIDITEKNQYENKIIRAIIKTQEDERYEIGGELHDNVCQIIAACQFSLGMLQNAVSKEKIHLLDQCKEQVKMALIEIRNLSHRLAPAFFDNSNLEDAFVSLFNTFNVSEQAEIFLDVDESVKKYPPSMEVQLNLYRIMQEQLRNILKYAKANVIKVIVFIHNQKLKLEITDNGIGFNKDAAINGIGLANMKRRTELFSGKFEIITSPGNGCSILVSIPLSASN
ncbi:MAG: PAS domain S-box protein [Ferruginibacter sp.]|nr:PAS domain S-box protein [Ferruginibacter sp.]